MYQKQGNATQAAYTATDSQPMAAALRYVVSNNNQKYMLIQTYTAAFTTLEPHGTACLCPFETQDFMFTCQVSFDGTSPNRLQWTVHFSGHDSLSQHDIRQPYLPNDPVGESHRKEDIFVFTLTSSSSLGLNSTLMVNYFNNSYINLINGTTVSCSQGNESDSQQAVIQILNVNGD